MHRAVRRGEKAEISNLQNNKWWGVISWVEQYRLATVDVGADSNVPEHIQFISSEEATRSDAGSCHARPPLRQPGCSKSGEH